MLEELKKYTPPTRNAEYAYKMGYDCEINGANTTNCHFSIFSSKENTRAWEEGKKAAAREKEDRI